MSMLPLTAVAGTIDMGAPPPRPPPVGCAAGRVVIHHAAPTARATRIVIQKMERQSERRAPPAGIGASGAGLETSVWGLVLVRSSICAAPGRCQSKNQFKRQNG